MKKSVFLVTGGTGFVGRSIIQKLVSNNYKVKLISRKNENPMDSNITVFQGDITKYTDLKNALTGCDGVIHCAGEKNDTSLMYQTNVTVTKTLFSLARAMNIGKFIHLSSVGVIGKTKFRMIDETTQCAPMNKYEETKYEAEKIVKEGLPNGEVIILRPTNVFGVETLSQWLEGNLLSAFRSFLKGNENTHLVSVDEVANATLHLITYKQTNKVETYIISRDDDKGTTFRDIHTIYSKKISRFHSPLPVSAPLFFPYLVRLIKNGATNYGDKVYSSSKLLRTGFTFRYSFLDELSMTLEQLKMDK